MDYKQGKVIALSLTAFVASLLFFSTGQAIEIENAVSITAVVPATSTASTAGGSSGTSHSGGGGGGGGGASKGDDTVNLTSTDLIVEGTSFAPGTVSLLRDGRLALKGATDSSGKWSLTLQGLTSGTYNFSVSLDDGAGNLSSSRSFSVTITAGITTLVRGISLSQAPQAAAPDIITADGTHDLNQDRRVDIVDFSILAYWVDRPNPPAATDFNKDGKVDLVDFSILAYYWTGS